MVKKAQDQHVYSQWEGGIFPEMTGYTDVTYWKHEENLDCPEFIETFLVLKGLVKEKTVQKENLSDSESNDSELKKKRDAADKPKSFAMGLDPEQDATDSGGELMFLMKWKDRLK